MRYINGNLILNKTDVKNLKFSLSVLKQDIGTRDDKVEDAKAQAGYVTILKIAHYLDVGIKD